MADMMTDTGFYFFQAMLLILLAVVGALVLWLHFQFRRFRQVNQSMPLLSDQLTSHLQGVQKAMADLRETAMSDMPKLEAKLSEAKLMMQEMEYVLSRAEKVMGERGGVETPAYKPSKASQGTHQKPISSEQPLSMAEKEELLPQQAVQSRGENVDVPKIIEAARRVAPAYGANAYGAAAQRQKENHSENEEELRRVLEGRL